MLKGRKNAQTNGTGRGTFRFRYMDSNRQFEVEADNVGGESLMEGFRHVANAITGRTVNAPVTRLLKSASSRGAAEVLDETEEEPVETDTIPFPEQPLTEETEHEEDETDSSETAIKPKRKVKPPKLLSDVAPATAKVSLADFMIQKGATDMKDKYAVVAAWYKKEFNVTEITIDRIYSAFAHLGQETELPTEVEKPLKNLTYTKVKKWFDKVDGKAGTYSLNWVGESAVSKMGAAKP